MRDVYACLFHLAVPPGLLDSTVREAAQTALEWAFSHYEEVGIPTDAARGRWEGGLDYAEWSTLAASETSDRLWSLVYFQQDKADPSLGWRTTVQLAREGSDLRFTLRLAIEPIQMRVLPAQFSVGRPRIVPALAARFSGEIDGEVVSTTPVPVTSAEIPDLVDLLTSARRRLPVVVVTIDPRLGRPLIDERKMADRLVGIAHVRVITSGAATYELTDRVGKQFSVFGGAVRVYWPGFSLDADPFDHRIWLPDRIEQFEASARPLVERMTRLISSVAVLRVPVDPLGRRLRAMADATAARELEDLRERLAAAPDEFTDELWTDYQRLFDAERALRDQVETLEAELVAMQQNFATLAREYGVGGLADVIEPDEIEEVGSPREAVDAVALEYPDELVFLPEALEAADASTYPNVPKLAAALRTIGEVARRWRADSLPAGFANAFREAGLDYAPDVSELTVGRTASEYRRSYDGRDITLGPHIKLGHVCRPTRADLLVGRRRSKAVRYRPRRQAPQGRNDLMLATS
jgi:hypothetical protein